MKRARPPRLAEALLALRVAGEYREFALGDLAQEYAERRAARGRLAARAWYWWQALRTLMGRGGARPPRRAPGGHRRRRHSFVETVGRDALLALRSFARAPLFTAAAIATLALGIGATTVVFGLADGLLFRPIPGIASPKDVALVRGCSEAPGYPDSCVNVGLSYPNLHDVASRLRTGSGLAGVAGGGEAEIVVGDAAPLSLRPQYVSASYFEVLGVRPHMGRTFTREEDDPAGGAPVAVISHRLWRRLFAGSREALGKEIRVSGKAFTIIGVAERGFNGTERGRDDLWLPGSTRLWVTGWEGDLSARATSRDFNELVVRRKDGTSWEQVEAELDGFSPWLAEQYPDANAKFRDVDFRLRPNVGQAPRGAATVISALLAVVGLILLIACANVSSLLLIKGLRRRGEVAVRKALGASSGRLIAQHLTESVTLWALGGAAGVALAFVLIRLVEQSLPDASGLLLLDARVLAFVAALSLVVGSVFGALPALTVARVEAARWLGRGTSAVTGGRGRVRGLLAVVQLAATLSLLVGALLMNRTLDSLASIDLGFNPRGVTVFEVSLAAARYDEAARVEYYWETLRRLRSDPGVDDAALALTAPFVGGNFSSAVRLAGEGGAGVSVGTAYVGSRFFDVLGIPLQAGRAFTDDEALSSGPRRGVILGASAARRLFGEADPLGRLVEFPRRGEAGPPHRVIGVAADIRFSSSSLTGDVDAMVYRPFVELGSSIPGDATFLVRSDPANRQVGRLVRAVAASLDQDTRIAGLQALEDAVTRFYGGTTTVATLTGSMALLAALLAAVGLYGVVGVAADARMREFGIRVALGASPRALLVAVVAEAAGVVMAGLLLGMVGSFALGVVLESFLYGVSPLDPLSWILAALLLGVIAAIAIVGPARRATSLDPVEVLRAG